MKILACCSGGMNRSGGLKAALLVAGRLGDCDVLTIGLNSNSDATKEMLFEWADIICVCGETELLQLVPKRYSPKTRLYNVGHDTYGSPQHWSLIHQFLQLMKGQPL